MDEYNPKDYYSVVTDVGKEKIAAAALNKDKTINICKFAAGDGSGTKIIPDSGMTELVSQVWEGGIKSYSVEGNSIKATALIPVDEGNFTIREIGVFDDEGTLIAIGSVPDIVRLTGETILSELELTISVTIENTEAISFTVEKYTYDYAYCRSSGEAAEKEAVCDEEFALYKGQHVYVVFDNANTAAETKLNVNKTGAYPIYNKGVAILPDILEAGNTYLFVFDGEHYNLIGDIKHRHTDLEERIDDVANRGLIYDNDTWTMSLSGGGGGSATGGEGSYTLPVATASRLGGVIIGKGLNAEGDGRISPDYDVLDEKYAIDELSEEEVQKVIEAIKGE